MILLIKLSLSSPILGLCYQTCRNRLLHNPILMAVVLSVEYETWSPAVWHQPSVIAQSTCRLENALVVMNSGPM